MIKLDDIDGKTKAAKKACLQKCLWYQTRTSAKVTGCEVIWDQSNRGCYGESVLGGAGCALGWDDSEVVVWRFMTTYTRVCLFGSPH